MKPEQDVTFMGLPTGYRLRPGFSVIQAITIPGKATIMPARVFVSKEYEIVQVHMASGGPPLWKSSDRF